MRVTSRWLLPAAGAAFAVLLSAQAAHAANLTVTATTPAGATTDTPLTWDITSADSSPTSCRLDDANGTAIAPLADCATSVSYPVATQPAGTFTLVVYNDTKANVDLGATPETATSSVTVLPPAPVVTAPTSPDSDRTPTWSITLPAGATGACTVKDANGNVVVPTTACNGTQYTPALGSTAPNGDYTLRVVASVGTLDSAPTTSTYTLAVPPPGAPTVTSPASPDNDKTPTFTIAGVASGDSVSCDVTGPSGVNVTVSDCTTSSATLTINGNSGLDGDYVLSVVATDPAGNKSDPGTDTYTLDVTGPPQPDVTAPTSPGTTRSPGFTVSNPDAGATCSVSGPGTAVTVTGCGTGTVTLDLTGHPDGDYVLTVTVTDAVGNTSSGSATYTLDTSPPTTPTISGSHGPSQNRTPDFTVTNIDADATLTCGVSGGAATVTACGSTVSLDITGADGTYTLSVTATDPLGNAVTTTYLYVLDTVVPAPTVTGVPTLTKSKTVTLGISDSENGVTLSCVLVGPDGTVFSGACPGDGVFDTTGHGDGTYTLTVTATDAAGNSSTRTVSWDRDSTAPPQPDVTGTPTLTKSKTVTLGISDSENGVALTCVLVGPDGTVFSGACPGDGVFDTTGHIDGLYTLTVTATDAAGNTSTRTVSWTRDSTAPPRPDVTGTPTLTNSTSVTLTISDSENGVGLTCVLVGPDGTDFSGPCPGDGVFDTTGHGDGLYTLTVTATDAAGNTSTRTVSWTRDTVAPPQPGVTGTPTLTRFKSVTLGITDAENGVTLTCLLVGPDGTVFNGTCPANGTFDTTGHPDGTYTLTVTATDAAGNSSTRTVSWDRDSTAPPQPDVTGTPTLTKSKTVTLGISDSENGVTLTCLLVGPDGTVFSGPCPTDGTFDTTGHIDGQYTLTVTATDAAGNTASRTVSWTRDSTAPPQPTVTGTPTLTRFTTVTLTIGDSENGVTLSCVLVGPDGTVFSGACPANGVFDTTGHGDGTYTLTVTATDAAGNSSTRTVSWTRDTAAPPQPGVTGVPTLTRFKSVTLGITDSENGVALTCLLVGPDGTVFSGPCPASGVFDTTGHVDGLYTLTVTATDAAGNSSSTTVSWDRDSTAPPQPSVTGAPTLTRFDTTGVTISDSENGVTLTCVLVGPDGTVFSGPCPANGVFDTSGHIDGVYTLTVTATDAAGNTSTRTVSWTRDSTAPPQPTVTGVPTLTKSKTLTLGISDSENGVTLTCVLDGPDGTVFSGPCPANGVFDTTGHIDGHYTLTVTATDAAGNTSTRIVGWDRDTLAPPTPTVSAPPTLTRFPTVTLTISDSENGVTLTCRLTGPDGTVFSGPCPANGLFDTTGHVDGVYVLTVTATDAAGNTASTTVSWTRDSTAPPKPTVSGPPDPNNRVSPVVTISDSESGVALSCVLVGPDGTDFAGTCPADGVFDTTGHGDGLYTLTVTATDAAGNSSSTTITWVRDTVDPPAPDVSQPRSLTNSRTVDLSISDSENGVTLTCVLVGPDGTDFSGLCPNSGRFDTTGHGDGLYTLTVTATDAAGNTASTTVSWLRDVTPPPAPQVSGPADPTNDKTPVVTISDSENGVALTCVLVGPDGTDFTGACPSDGVFDTRGHGDGRYTLTVTATDAAGNSSSTTISWLRDTVAPLAPGVTAPGSPAQGRHPTFTVSPPETPVTWNCTVTGPSTVQVTACGTSTTIDLTGAADGTYTLHVIAIDPAGNWGAEGTATYTLDTTPPPAPSVSAPPSLTKSRTVTLTIGDTESGVVITCHLVGPNGGTVYNAVCPADGVFDTTGHADGLYTLTVTATDSAGNASTTTVSWMRDTIAPVAPTVTAPVSPAQGRNPGFTVTAQESPVTWTCTVSGPSTVSIQNCGPNAKLDLTGAQDGVYTLFVTATDPAGNTSSAGSASYELDTTAPPKPTVVAPQSPASDRSPSFVVTDAENGVTWSCTVSGPSQVTTTSCGPTTVVDLQNALDGTYTLSVYALDFAGNRSLAGTATYVLDTTAPPPPSVSAPPTLTKNFTVTVSISDSEAGVSITCSVTSPGGRSVFAGPCPANGTFDTTGFSDGVYTLVVTATDAAGNASTTTVTWTRDTQAPPTPSVSAPSSPAKNRTPVFSVGDSESGVTYHCTVAGPSTVTVTSCGPNTQVSLVGAADGLYTLTVVAIDAAGNVSSADSASYLLDTTAPVTPSVTASPSPSQSPHATFSVGNIETDGVLTCTFSAPTGATVTLHGCSTSMALDLTGQPDGVYVVTVTVTDAAGNVSSAGSASYVLDTTPPGAPNVDPPASPGHDRQPTLIIGTEPGAALTCTVARYFQTIFTGPCPASGVLDLSGYEDGEFEISVFATDRAGNVGPTTVFVYVLDTVAPEKPVITAPASPSPVEHPMWFWTASDDTTTTCTVTDAGGAVVQGPVVCASPFIGAFSRLPDGAYTLTVVVTDAAGNSTAVTSVFLLDRRAPVPPTVVPPRSPNDTYHPVWDITAPRGATLTCTLMRGDTVVFGPLLCPDDGRFSLSGMPDGTYTLYVIATDSAGNVSAQSKTLYVLDTHVPHSPRLDYSSPSPSTDTSPYWGFTLPDGTTGRCILMHGSEVLASKQCTGAVSFDLSGHPSGTYTLRIYAVDDAGNTSDPLVLTYVLGDKSSGGGTGGPPPPPGDGGGNPGGGTGPVGPVDSGTGGNQPRTDRPSPSAVQQTIQKIERLSHFVRDGARKVGHTATDVVQRVVPIIHDRFTEDVSSAVQGVVDAVAHAGGGTGFPLMLLLVVLAFLLMQNRIDRRDPKLALASVAADDTVEFLPPPSRGGGMFA